LTTVGRMKTKIPYCNVAGSKHHVIAYFLFKK
jgi:hypothetical protein